MNQLHEQTCKSRQSCSVLTRSLTQPSFFFLQNKSLNTQYSDVYPKHLDSRSLAFEQCISFVILEKLRYGAMVVRG